MRTLPLLLSLAILPGMASAQQNPPPEQDKRQEDVVKRGEHVMGFSHEATMHHFRLFRDGGEIDVRANDPKDKASIDQIRTHFGHIAKMFASGNFNAPMLIHDTNPPGTATMTRLKEQIRYEFSETDRGAADSACHVHSEHNGRRARLPALSNRRPSDRGCSYNIR
jgi:hypothetical protein